MQYLEMEFRINGLQFKRCGPGCPFRRRFGQGNRITPVNMPVEQGQPGPTADSLAQGYDQEALQMALHCSGDL